MHPGETYWPALTAAELNARLRAGAVALWAVGATEQHGPHLVTGFDHLAAQAVVTGAAARLGPRAVVLPPLAVGASRHWTSLGGTLSLSAQTLLAVLTDVCRSAAAAGTRRLVIVNGHMGNVATGMVAAAEDLGELEVEFVSYWDLIDRELLAGELRSDVGVGHAGEFETAIALHLGGLVREDEVPVAPAPGTWPGRPFDGPVIHRSVRARDTRGGVVGDASAATAAVGAALLESAIAALAAHLEAVDGRSSAPGLARDDAEPVLVPQPPDRENT